MMRRQIAKAGRPGPVGKPGPVGPSGAALLARARGSITGQPTRAQQQDDLAVTLLAEALAEIEREPADLASMLDRIPGSWERMQLGRQQAARELRALDRFPEMGHALGGRWSGTRYVLGPWSWLVIVYEYDESADVVVVLTMQDARRAESPTNVLAVLEQLAAA